MADKSTVRNVIHSGLEAFPLIVYNCPLNKRIWKSGYKMGKSYASVFDDCRNCSFGEVVYEKKSFNNGDTTTDGPIKEVCCKG